MSQIHYYVIKQILNLKDNNMPLCRRMLLHTIALLVNPASIRVLTAGTPAPKDAYLYFVWPHDGQRVRSPFWCRFGLRNMGVTHAGDATPNRGHHHLFIDVNGAFDLEQPIPSDRKHLHFGDGETETYLELQSGRHTLQLMLGDAEHKSFTPLVISRKISIVVV